MPYHKDRIEAARRYALADRSDPFAFDRAMLHMRTGVCGFTPQGKDAFYTADEVTEIRTLPDGGEYTAIVYKNIARP